MCEAVDLREFGGENWNYLGCWQKKRRVVVLPRRKGGSSSCRKRSWSCSWSWSWRRRMRCQERPPATHHVLLSVCLSCCQTSENIYFTYSFFFFCFLVGVCMYMLHVKPSGAEL